MIFMRSTTIIFAKKRLFFLMSRIRIQENVQFLSSNFFKLGFLLASFPRDWDAIKQFWAHQVNQKGQLSIIPYFYGNSEIVTFFDRRVKSTHSGARLYSAFPLKTLSNLRALSAEFWDLTILNDSNFEKICDLIVRE